MTVLMDQRPQARKRKAIEHVRQRQAPGDFYRMQFIEVVAAHEVRAAFIAGDVEDDVRLREITNGPQPSAAGSSHAALRSTSRR